MTELSRKQADFLYWHAVSKMRVGEFEDARVLYRLMYSLYPERTDAALGLAYSLVRTGLFAEAAALVAQLRRRLLQADEMALLGRMHRRCEFERARAGRATGSARLRAGGHAPVQVPHLLGEDAMASQRSVGAAR